MTMLNNAAYWTRNPVNGQLYLVVPDTYGKPQAMSPSQAMGRYTVDQLVNLRNTLPVH